MVQAALLTGARYAELAALEVRDYDPTSRTVWLRETKAGVARPVYLEEEGMRLFEEFTIGKSSTQIIFLRPDGKKWGPSQQARPLAKACEAADRKSVVWGKSVSVSVDLGGCRITKKKTK